MNGYGETADNQVSGDVNITGNIDVTGDGTFENLNVTDTLTANTIIAAEEIQVTDNIILMGKDNPADVLNTGILEEHTDGVKKWSGLMRYHIDKKQYLIEGTTPEPTTTSDISADPRADLVIKNLTAVNSQIRQLFLRNDSSVNKWIIENDESTDELLIKDSLGAAVLTVAQDGTLASSGAILEITKDNPANLINTGFISEFNDGVPKYSGLLRYPATGRHYLVEDSSVKPDTATDVETIPLGELRLGRCSVNPLAGDAVISCTPQSSANASFSTGNPDTTLISQMNINSGNLSSVILKSTTRNRLDFVDFSDTNETWCIDSSASVDYLQFEYGPFTTQNKVMRIHPEEIIINSLSVGPVASPNYTFPVAQGTANQVITDVLGDGVLTWQNSPSPFDQDLNTTDTPTFKQLSLTSTQNALLTLDSSPGFSSEIRCGPTDKTDLNATVNLSASNVSQLLLNADTEAQISFSSGTQYLLEKNVANDYLTWRKVGGNTPLLIDNDGITSTKISVGPVLSPEYSLPLVDGNSDQILRTDGAGTLTFEPGVDNKTQSTGVLSGGFLTENVDTTKFDISDGIGQIVNPTTGVITPVSWTGLIAQSQAYVGNISYVYINSGGTVTYKTTKSDGDKRDDIFLGAIDHSDQINIDEVENEQMALVSTTNQIADLAHAVGHIKTSGNVLSDTGSGLTFQKSAGTMYAFGSNWPVNAKAPSNVSLPLFDTSVSDTFQYVFQDGSTGPLTDTDINPNKYDTGTSYPGTDVDDGKDDHWTVQRIYVFPDNAIKIMPGQEEYKTENLALESFESEIFNVTDAILENGLLLGYLLVQATTTDLSGAGATFIQASKFGGCTGGGSSSADSVIGPNSATDSAIMLFDGITGKTAKNSQCLITDDGELTLSNDHFTNGLKVGGTFSTLLTSIGVVNTIAEIDVLNYGSVPASYWKVGDTLRCRLSGNINQTLTPQFQFKIYLHNTVIGTSFVNMNSGGTFTCDIEFVFRTVGVGGSGYGNAQFIVGTGTGPVYNNIAIGLTNMDTTNGASDLRVIAQWSTADVLNGCTIHNARFSLN